MDPILEWQTYKMFTILTGVKDGNAKAADISIYIESVDVEECNSLMDSIRLDLEYANIVNSQTEHLRSLTSAFKAKLAL